MVIVLPDVRLETLDLVKQLLTTGQTNQSAPLHTTGPQLRAVQQAIDLLCPDIYIGLRLVGSAAELKTGVNIGDSDFTDLIDDTSLRMIRSRGLKIKERVEPLTFVAVMQNDPENSSTQNNNNITRSPTVDQFKRFGFPNTNKNLKYNRSELKKVINKAVNQRGRNGLDWKKHAENSCCEENIPKLMEIEVNETGALVKAPAAKVECSICNKTVTRQHLKSHIKMVHQGRKYKCGDCDYILSEKHGVKKHCNAVGHDVSKISSKYGLYGRKKLTVTASKEEN